MITLLRTATWVCVTILAVLSLLPGKDMLRSGLPGHIEHFIAYAGTGMVATAAYGPPNLRTVMLLWAYAGLLEYLQRFSPGRHPAVADFLSSALGALCGTIASVLLRRAVRYLTVAN